MLTKSGDRSTEEIVSELQVLTIQQLKDARAVMFDAAIMRILMRYEFQDTTDRLKLKSRRGPNATVSMSEDIVEIFSYLTVQASDFPLSILSAAGLPTATQSVSPAPQHTASETSGNSPADQDEVPHTLDEEDPLRDLPNSYSAQAMEHEQDMGVSRATLHGENEVPHTGVEKDPLRDLPSSYSAQAMEHEQDMEESRVTLLEANEILRLRIRDHDGVLMEHQRLIENLATERDDC